MAAGRLRVLLRGLTPPPPAVTSSTGATGGGGAADPSALALRRAMTPISLLAASRARPSAMAFCWAVVGADSARVRCSLAMRASTSLCTRPWSCSDASSGVWSPPSASLSPLPPPTPWVARWGSLCWRSASGGGKGAVCRFEPPLVLAFMSSNSAYLRAHSHAHPHAASRSRHKEQTPRQRRRARNHAQFGVVERRRNELGLPFLSIQAMAPIDDVRKRWRRRDLRRKHRRRCRRRWLCG